MSKTRDVIRNKNRVEKARRAQRKQELLDLRGRSLFKAQLYRKMNDIDIILSSPDVQNVIITVPDEALPLFSEAIYSNELSSYVVEQVENEPNKFTIKNRIISL